MNQYTRFGTPRQDVENTTDDKSDINNTKWRHINDKNKFMNFGSFTKKRQILQKPQENIENRKTLLCNNIISSGHCGFGDTCKYAHSLDDQVKEKQRKPIFDILFSDSDLSHINFQENVGLYRGLLSMTKLCDKEKCPGGYNCRYGACRDTKVHICEQDLNHGNCNVENCTKIHLTKRGLRPFWSGYGKEIKNVQENNKPNDVQGILLSEGFWKLNSSAVEDDLISNLSLSSDESDSRSNSSEEYSQSIFSEKKCDNFNINNIVNNIIGII